MPKERSNIRVVIADDHAIFRDGLRKLLGSDESISVESQGLSRSLIQAQRDLVESTIAKFRVAPH